MGMNPPPIERQVPAWGWWADPELATMMFYSARFNEPMPDDVRENAPTLFRKGYHPSDAITLVMEGFERVALGSSPKGWRGIRTAEEWLKRFPDVRLGSRRTR